MTREARIVLLCAGEIGFRCLGKVLETRAARVLAVFSYRVEPPQGKYLDLIRELAAAHEIPLYETQNVARAEYRDLWAALKPDYIFAIKWRTMIPAEVVDTSLGGLIIFHAALLPEYRGFAPVNWPLINGESKTGVTMFYAADEVDSGDIIDQREIPLTDEDDAGTLDRQVTETVERMLIENLPRLIEGTAPKVPQDHSRATYAIWRSPEDGRIAWGQPARAVFNLIRGLTDPYPGAFTFLDGRKLFIWSAEMEPEPRRYAGIIPGKVERIIPGRGVMVLAGDGPLLIKDVQLEGDTRRNAAEVIKKLKTKLE